MGTYAMCTFLAPTEMILTLFKLKIVLEWVGEDYLLRSVYR